MYIIRPVFLLAAFASCSFAQPISSTGAVGQSTVRVNSQDNSFCLFLPPKNATDRTIADNEKLAVTYCTNPSQAQEQFPDGFILSAHFNATQDYVQVTGGMDPTKAHLDPKDEGGQFDTRAPQGASCE
ncbi:hypothetical protein DFQ28_010928, partial [Apophysomyces sp. BC1034]